MRLLGYAAEKKGFAYLALRSCQCSLHNGSEGFRGEVGETSHGNRNGGDGQFLVTRL
jgi:hypothetical protein